jgi:hypothetical protein
LKQRNSTLLQQSLRVPTKDLQRGQKAFLMPAPERFARKSKLVSMKAKNYKNQIQSLKDLKIHSFELTIEARSARGQFKTMKAGLSAR